MEVCVVRNDVDEFGRYLRFLDVAERWKRRPDGAEEWVQAGKLRDQVLLELEGIYREWFGELPLETLFLGEFGAYTEAPAQDRVAWVRHVCHVRSVRACRPQPYHRCRRRS